MYMKTTTVSLARDAIPETVTSFIIGVHYYVSLHLRMRDS